MRLVDVLERVRQLMKLENTDAGTVAEVELCITQLSNIADMRHKLVHRPALFLSNRLVVSNVLTAKSLTNFEVHSFNPQELANMALDCGSIYLRLSALIEPPQATVAEMLPHAKQPWRYKPVPLAPEKKSRPKAPEAQ